MAYSALKGRLLMEWMDKNAQENQGYDLKVGDKVYSATHCHRGIIRELRPGRRHTGDRGSIVVDLITGGQHKYDFYGWQTNFRISR